MSAPRQTFNQSGARVPAQEAQHYGRDLLDGLRKQMPDMDDILWLIKNGAALDIQDARGDTALHLAIRMQRADVVQEMLSRTADVNTPNKAGNTPVILAATGGSEILRAVITAGTDVKHLNNGGNDALTCAVAAGKSANVRLLLDAGAEVKQKLLEMAERLHRGSLLPMLHGARDAFGRAASTAARDIPLLNMPRPQRPPAPPQPPR